MTSTIKPEDYIMKFGKFINMRAVDISKIHKVNPKTGKDEAAGLKYLKFICEQDWFKHKSILEQVIKQAEENMTEPEGNPKKKESKSKDVFHKKGFHKEATKKNQSICSKRF